MMSWDLPALDCDAYQGFVGSFLTKVWMDRRVKQTNVGFIYRDMPATI